MREICLKCMIESLKLAITDIQDIAETIRSIDLV